MKSKVITSVFATVLLGFFAFFSNAPKKMIKIKSKITKNKRTIPLKNTNDDSYDLFI